MRPAGIILSAGRSSRMGSDKALLKFGPQTFLDRLITLFLPRVDPLVVVLGHKAEKIQEHLALPNAATIALNSDYDRGMLSSLQVGLSSLPQTPEWCIFTLVDHPVVRGRTLDRIAAACQSGAAPLVIPTFGGKRGHPVAIAKPIIEQLKALDPSASPQDTIRAHYDQAKFVEVDDPGVVADIDRPEDYEQVRTSALSATEGSEP